ncbi:DUF6503 family protein [Roseivirga pacifica]
MNRGMYMHWLSVIALATATLSCGPNKERLSADQVIDKAIERHGGEKYDNMEVEFDFRSRHFRAKISEGQYVYERSFKTKDGWVTDVLDNDHFKRMVGEKEVDLTVENLKTYRRATNSVIYFALLPFNLDDPVVNRQLMKSVSIKGEPYYKVEITYGHNGGGEEFENAYVYWIHKENFTIDYLAYSFNINGGGVRFREAVDIQEVQGIRFQDYLNYTIDTDFPAQELDYAYQTGKLKLISEIRLENIQVKLNAKP